MGGLGQLSIVIETADLQAGERFADALGARLRQLPPGVALSVHWKIDDERAFVDAHGALYADAQDLLQVRNSLRDSIEKAKNLAEDSARLIRKHRAEIANATPPGADS